MRERATFSPSRGLDPRLRPQASAPGTSQSVTAAPASRSSGTVGRQATPTALRTQPAQPRPQGQRFAAALTFYWEMAGTKWAPMEDRRGRQTPGRGRRVLLRCAPGSEPAIGGSAPNALMLRARSRETGKHSGEQSLQLLRGFCQLDNQHRSQDCPEPRNQEFTSAPGRWPGWRILSNWHASSSKADLRLWQEVRLASTPRLCPHLTPNGKHF